jgi:hypothetical protein
MKFGINYDYLMKQVSQLSVRSTIFATCMKKVRRNNVRVIVAVFVMFASLGWLTVSLPFVNGAQLHAKATAGHSDPQDASGHENPLSNSVEEKNENAPVSISEYLHMEESVHHIEQKLSNYSKCHPSQLYFAFHPELISPPPEGLS